MVKNITLCVIATLTLNGFSQISEKQIKKDITFLASDKLKGRGTSTNEEKLAANYIAKQFKTCGLMPKGNDNYLYHFTFKKNSNPHDTSIVNIPERNGINVIGFLDNKAENTIVIGAHYDHLGLGHDHNSLDANPENKIHNGADDNASGTSGVLELARYFSNNTVKENYNFLFICFSGEELGLLGSKKWCDNPSINLSSIKKDSSGIGPSDQTSFYLKDIPVLHFFTGQHSDYHKPSDDVDKINISGEKKVLDYIVELINATNSLPRLVFTKTSAPVSTSTKWKVTMGVMPDYAFEGEGMRIDGVSDNKPGFKAGVKTGDVVIKLGELNVKNVQDYMKALSVFKKGDKTIVVVKRGNENLSLELEF